MSSTPQLRPYQPDLIARVEAEIAVGHWRIVLVAAIGAGNAIIPGAIVADAVAHHCRAWTRHLSRRGGHRRRVTPWPDDGRGLGGTYKAPASRGPT